MTLYLLMISGHSSIQITMNVKLQGQLHTAPIQYRQGSKKTLNRSYFSVLLDTIILFSSLKTISTLVNYTC